MIKAYELISVEKSEGGLKLQPIIAYRYGVGNHVEDRLEVLEKKWVWLQI